MAMSKRQVAKADPNAQLSEEEEAQLQQMQNEPDEADEAAPTEPEAEPPESELEPEPQPEPKKGDPNVGLREERNARKKLERELAEERKRLEEERKRNQTLEQRTNQILERFAQQQQQQPPAQPPQPPTPDLPDVQTDPVGHILAQLKRYNDRVEEVSRVTQAQEAQRSAAAQIGTIEQQALAMEQVFRKETPDYDAAVRFLAENRDYELQEAGHSNPAERQLIMRNEAIGLAQMAINNGRNPGEVIYKIAKARGYHPPDPQTPTTSQASPQTVSGRDRLETVQRGQQQARSLGAVRGTGPAPLNADMLARMSYEEFDKFLKTAEGMALLGS